LRKFYYIRANPKHITGDEYNNLVRQYPLPNNLFIMDFVGDVDKYEVKEVTADEFNKLNNQ